MPGSALVSRFWYRTSRRTALRGSGEVELPMVTIDERAERARIRWDRTVARCTSTRAQVEHSRWLITSSRAVLDRPRPLFRGGADERVADRRTLARLRALIVIGVLPRTGPTTLWAGRCRETQDCLVCHDEIALGALQFEITYGRGRRAVLHRGCLDLWLREVEYQNDHPSPPSADIA
jgi:hypothetical protein